MNFTKATLMFILTLSLYASCKYLNGEPSLFDDDAKIKIHSISELDIDDSVIKEIKQKKRNAKNVTAIIVHITGNFSAKEYMTRSIQSGFCVHYIIDKKGNIYGENRPFSVEFEASPYMDPVAVHISVEGTNPEISENIKQIDALTHLTEKLMKDKNIPANNYDVSSKAGIFSHIQCKKRFGAFVSLLERDSQPALKLLLNKINGKYYDELQWKDRFKGGWIHYRENAAVLAGREKHNRGRGLTSTPNAELKSVEQLKSGAVIDKNRILYVHRGVMMPTCAVLHFTGTRTLRQAINGLSDRRLSAHIIVDTDGLAYQVMDTLKEKAAAAVGTNEKCIQIEIIGLNTHALMNNPAQTSKVVMLVKELSLMFRFPISNYDIDSLHGVFSHTQAKRRWGRSVFLEGKDFDPGEPYMKKVLTSAGGKYFEEENWKDRKAGYWTILLREFQP